MLLILSAALAAPPAWDAGEPARAPVLVDAGWSDRYLRPGAPSSGWPAAGGARAQVGVVPASEVGDRYPDPDYEAEEVEVRALVGLAALVVEVATEGRCAGQR